MKKLEDFDIESFLSLHDYADEKRKSRRKGPGGTQEFFTPYELVKKMCDNISDEEWSDSTKTFLEPCFGNGQFLLYIIYMRLIHGVDIKDILSTIYGVELVESNVKQTKDRIFELLDNLCILYNRDELLKIIDRNLVCSDLFEWDFDNWCKLENVKNKNK